MTEENAKTTNSVIVKEDEVYFDAKGRATIENSEANEFIKETLAREGAIEISAPGRAADVNIILCGSGNNGYCPKK